MKTMKPTARERLIKRVIDEVTEELGFCTEESMADVTRAVRRAFNIEAGVVRAERVEQRGRA